MFNQSQKTISISHENKPDPMSPGISWYETNIEKERSYSPFSGETYCDIVIIGGGFTGLSAAFHLASGGAHVILLEERSFGLGASGRNGGQLGTGQRLWVEQLEHLYGFERSLALFNLAEDAKSYLFDFAAQAGIDMEYVAGHLSVAHKARYRTSYLAHVQAMERYGYPHLSFLDREETAYMLGSNRYFCALHDRATGHIHPLKLLFGTVKAAEKAGVQLYENSKVISLQEQGQNLLIKTQNGSITAPQALIATNAYDHKLLSNISAHILPIRSFIAATPPLDPNSPILPTKNSVDDSRFVVRYFRKTNGHHLLFGGSEAYGWSGTERHKKKLRHQLSEIYPDLAHIPFTHFWGGTVGITVPRLPYVADFGTKLTYCGGYSGHGIMLSHYFGKLYADTLLGKADRLKPIKDLKIARFPGGILRFPLLFFMMHWLAFLDRI